MNILAHRANLDGPSRPDENRLTSLNTAVASGFDVEFDINLSPDGTRLVLTHDPAEWSEERDALTFLRQAQDQSFHALNVKHLLTVPAICRALDTAGTAKHFFFFDFELLTEDLAGCRFLMCSLSDAGYPVAYRLSDREPFLEQYLRQKHVSLIWLDEFETAWAGQEQFAALADSDKQVYCVSPDLHGQHDADTLKRRWEQWCSWGVTGICTDYPTQLAQFLGEQR